MYYDRRIHYLDYQENGERVRNAGFVKIEVTDRVCNILVNVTGLRSAENCVREVRFLSSMPEDAPQEIRENIFGEIRLCAGKGILQKKRIPVDGLCENLSLDALETIRIGLGKSRELVCHLRQERRSEGEEGEQEPQGEEREQEPQGEEREQEPQGEEREQELQGEKREQEPQGQEAQGQPQGQKTGQEAMGLQPALQTAELPFSPQEKKEAEPPEAPVLHEKKWKRLWEIYPHIFPFQDERAYLSIGPGDFVIFPEKYYRLIGNSFLLHGFYNYGHMVLKRMRVREGERYYLGVPGNFYEKERQVAVMFGFESFECRREPVQEGDFGYFMIGVEL